MFGMRIPQGLSPALICSFMDELKLVPFKADQLKLKPAQAKPAKALGYGAGDGVAGALCFVVVLCGVP